MAVARASLEANIKEFVFISSTQALDEDNQSPYAQSKRSAARGLAIILPSGLNIVYLASVQTESFSGRLGFLNRLPRILARPIFAMLAALKPTLDIKRLAYYLLAQDFTKVSTLKLLCDDKHQNLTYRCFRKTLDLGFALFVVVFLWWLLLAIWVLVKLTSPGPGIFAQKRVGKDGKEFTCWKFRSMKIGTQQVGTHELSEASITPVGRILRKLKFDELPQVFNILRGEISLIGPRPCLPSQSELISLRRSAGVFQLLPGISGLAQINGIDMSDPARLALWDAKYMALRCIVLDLKICFATATGRGQGDRINTNASNNIG